MATLQPDRYSLLSDEDMKSLRGISLCFLNACNKTEIAKNNSYVVLDFETTGLDMYSHEIVEYAAVRVVNGEMGESIQSLCKPHFPILAAATRVNGITNEMVRGERPFAEHLPALLNFIGSDIVMAHNAAFDMGFLNKYRVMAKLPALTTCSCTMRMAKWVLYGKLNSYRLSSVADYLGVGNSEYHRALGDAVTAARVYLELARLAEEARARRAAKA